MLPAVAQALWLVRRRPIVAAMKKEATHTGKRAAARPAVALSKAAAKAKPLAPVRQAAQKPVHATRAGIRRAVRAVTAARTHAVV